MRQNHYFRQRKSARSEPKRKFYRPREFNIEWINSIPKTINNNGCWIPLYNKPDTTGYVRIMINYQRFELSRLSMCICYDIDYKDSKIISRHNFGCNTSCFNYKHLQPGTHSDNVKDSVRDGTHAEASKICCSSCGGPFENYIIQTGPNRGKLVRVCRVCKHKNRYK